MLEIKNLHVTIDKKEVLRGINLKIKPNSMHVIMGPNGSGKSTLANVLVGKEINGDISGKIKYFNKDLLKTSPEERASEGLFLSFQHPIEISGVNNIFFLRTALNSLRKNKGQPEIDPSDFLDLIRDKGGIIGIDDAFLKRPVNFGFSGGEKKLNEILQMLVLDPTIIILDEPDSGLDIDALKVLAKAINGFLTSSKAMILITHYQRLLNYVRPDYIHILYDGRIVKSGDEELAHELERNGYEYYKSHARNTAVS